MRVRQKCWCGKDSLRGLNRSLCQYHYNCYMFGKTWADKCLYESLKNETAKSNG